MPSEMEKYFKELEFQYTQILDKTKTIILRVDGNNFSKWTRKNCEKPFDLSLSKQMVKATEDLMKFFNCSLAYTFSDEASLILYPSENEESELIFGGKVSKIISIAASVFTASFNRGYKNSDAIFDARVFNLDTSFANESNEYLIHRMSDCRRNAISTYARSLFSQSEIFGLHSEELLNKISSIGKDIKELEASFLRGTLIEEKTMEIDLTEEELSKIPLNKRPKGPVLRNKFFYR